MANEVNANSNGADPNKMLLIRAADAQAVLNSLAKQPCGEVYGLVTMMLNLQEAPKFVMSEPAVSKEAVTNGATPSPEV